MELKIGDVVTYGFRKFKVVPKRNDVNCEKICDFRNICLNITDETRKELIGSCFFFSRKDKTDIVFVETTDGMTNQ